MRPKQLAAIMKERRAKLSLTKEDLSEMAGVTSNTIYLIESGKGNPTFKTIQKVSEVLGLEISLKIKKPDE